MDVSHEIMIVTVTFVIVMTSHCSFFTKSRNQKRDRRIKIENRRDLNKRREKKRVKETMYYSAVFSEKVEFLLL